MTKNTVKFYSIVENLVPQYVKEEFPLVIEFLKQYYKSQENQSAALDIIHNIDKYVQVDNVADLTAETFLTYPVEVFDTEIFIHSSNDLPNNYGLIKIDNEIIWYEKLVKDVAENTQTEIQIGSNIAISRDVDEEWIGKVLIIRGKNNNIIETCKILNIESGLGITLDKIPILDENTFGYSSDNLYSCEVNGTKLINCSRGFNATVSYNSETNADELISESTLVESHNNLSVVKNLSIIFLKEFLKKIKVQLTPGFEDDEFYEKINEATFIKNIKQFYSSKGTDCSFELLFRSLFGEDVSIIRPRDYLIQPSDAQYVSFRDLIVEALEGDPQDLENLTLYQDEYLNIPQSRGTVAKVEKIQRGGKFYYVVSLDQTKENNYDSNLGKFSIHSKTKTTSNISFGSEFIDVDSTVGFPDSGEIEVETESQQKIVVSYSSKTSTQFLGCSGISDNISFNAGVRLNTYAYGYNGSNQIKVSVNGVLSSVNIESYPYYSSDNEKIQLETLGTNSKDIRTENWFYNIPVEYAIEKISLIDNFESNGVFKFVHEITLYDENILKIGDSISLLYSKGELKQGVIISKLSTKSFLAVGLGDININLRYSLRKNILKVNSSNYPLLSKYSVNVQNVYLDRDKKVFVNSQSLPNYLFEPLLITDRSVTFSGSYEDSEIITVSSHNFYTGDSVVYLPGEAENTLNIKKGIYFVFKVDNNRIKIARSRENLYTENFIKVTGNVSNNKFILEIFSNQDLSPKELLPQNIFREISEPQTPKNISITKTVPGTTGIFVNGVELLNYKSKDVLYYGEIEDIFPVSSGNGYDVINPPLLKIEDDLGSGAKGYVSVKGSLERVDIIDSGFDFIETPQAIISGGNGKDARVVLNLVSVDHYSFFNARTGVNTSTDTIGFTTYHKFRNNEVVFYDPLGQTKVSGLTTNSQYYVSVINPLSIKLYSKFEDSISGINTVNLTGIGTGRHLLKSSIKKKKIGSVQVINLGYGYENKKRSVSQAGINTFSGIISIENHGYSSGEIVTYTATNTNIGGISSGSSYYITKIDDDKFKLSNIGVGNTSKDFYYLTKSYVNFTSVGVGTHFFNYEPITIQIQGKTGIGSTSSNQAELRPIFTGQITSVHLESKGESYGSDIINFNRQANIYLSSGKSAQAKPIIQNGKIVEVVIVNSGSEYYSTPKIEVIGKGSGAILVPIIKNNSLTSIKIVSGGGGYSENTLINVVPSGSGAKFESKIKEWRFNLFERLLRSEQIPTDDGILYEGKDDKNGLEYTHLYAPRKLRSSVLGTRSLNGRVIYNPDLELINQVESTSLTHSPIIGWAYDGNPIYGPYGYSSITGGSVKQISSGYELSSSLTSTNRPNYPLGIFVEDYEFTNNGDLDEYNGRFCVTPEFPNGVYAYFCTFESGVPETSGSFSKYKKPKFPYVIGNYFKSNPIPFNFESTSNLNKFNLNDSSLLRNTKPYGLLNKNTNYSQIINLNDVKTQTSRIKSRTVGKVNSIEIVDGGKSYNIGDKISLSNEKVNAFVSQIKGKTVNNVSVSTTSIFDVEFIKDTASYVGYSSVPHNFITNDLVNISSSNEKNISGKIRVNIHTLNLRAGIQSSSVTGIVTHLDVYGSLNFKKIRENDIYLLGNEEIKVLNVDAQNSRLRILRNQNGTIGISSILVGTAITEKPRKFEINFGITTSYNFAYNRELYFDPLISVGLGTTSGVGITSTLFFNVVNFNHPVSIGTGATTILYFSNLKDLSEYKTGGYVDLVNSSNGSFNTTKKKIISIGSSSIGINFDTSSLSGAGVTSYINKWITKDIPTRSIYIPNHDFESGERLKYKSNGGTTLGVSTNGVNSFALTNGSEIYISKLSEDLIGISTVKVGLNSGGIYSGITTQTNNLGLLYFTSIGVGNTHSFTTTYDNVFIADVSKNVVTVQTKEPHGLSYNDEIEFSVLSGISTTVKITYNKKHRLTLVDARNFSSSDVDLVENTIRIYNHNLITGQKIIHTCVSSPVGGLVNDQIYYVVVVSGSKIRLSDTYYNAIKPSPDFINLTSISSGTISKINSRIDAIKNSKVIFDLSDSTLSFINNNKTFSAFELNFYTDSLFTNRYENSGKTKTFDVERFDRVGIDTTARVVLNTQNIPNILYYKLNPINKKINDTENLEIIIDSDVVNANQIIRIDSLFNGKYSISGVGTTTFTYNLKQIPEIDSYSSNFSDIEYHINSSSTNGPISKINVTSSPNNLKELPKVTDVGGKGAVLHVEGTDIGKIGEKDIEILDIGFDYPSDFSLRPTARFSSLFEIDSFSTIEKISVISPGKNYSVSPDLLLLDTYTNKIVDDAVIKYNIQNHTVNIIKNTNKISGNYIPKLIPTNNTNGVGISSISYDTSTKNVTVKIGKIYNSNKEFPFALGDKIYIENVSVGIGSTLKGYNSSIYDYSFFTIVGIHTNAGGVGAAVTYSMNDYLDDGEILGSFDSVNSSGKIILQKDLPVFKIDINKRRFFENEKVESNGSFGIVEYHDSDRDILKVLTADEFLPDSIIRGTSSQSVAKIKKIEEFRLNYNISESLVYKRGWLKETGFLNLNSQRLHDSDYYQYFSYSVKSKVDYEKWNESVSKLTHTSGFKKFSDLIVESDSKSSGMSKEQNASDISGISDIYTTANINCYYDFDTIKENNVVVNSKLGSNEIYFNSKVLQDYIESIGNRVLIIDDVSGQFDSSPRSSKFSTVDTFAIVDDFSLSIKYKKYFFSVKDSVYSDPVEVGLVSLLQDNNYGYINQYGFVNTEGDLGSFDFIISSGLGQLQFYPNKFKEDIYDIDLLAINIPEIASGVASTDIGNIVKINSNYTSIDTSTSSTIVSISSTYRSSKVIVQIGSTDGNYYEINELTLLHDNSEVSVVEYGFLSNESLNSYSQGESIATYSIGISGNNLNVGINPITGYGTSLNVNTFVVSIGNTSLTGIGTYHYSNGFINSKFVAISSSPTPSTNIISTFDSMARGGYYIASVEDKTNNSYQTSEIIVVRNNNSSNMTEFGILQTDNNLGQFTSDISGTNCRLLFTPIENADVEVRLCEFLISEFDESLPSELTLGNGSYINFSSGSYTGTELDIRKSFNLTHKQNPIFQKVFSGLSTSIVNVTNDTITIPNHFFVTGEEIEYSYGGSELSTTNAIGIATTSIIGIGNTNKLPTKLYIVKVDDGKVKVSASASESLLPVPKTLDINSVGIGTNHSFTSKNQNTKCLISIDNIIQSPIVSTSTTTILLEPLNKVSNIITVLDPSNFYGSDFIRINNEIMKIRSVGFGTTNGILVQRSLMGSQVDLHNTSDTVTKILGQYNIIDNTLHFSDPPFGKLPLTSASIRPDESDYSGIEVSSRFNGRAFTRSGIENSLSETYSKNYVIDSISNNFTGLTTQFTLTSNLSNISGISSSNAIILVNGVFQAPSKNVGISQVNQYTLTENVGITSIYFEGDLSSNYDSDISITRLPKGGIILSVGSTEGFGYQPLISAGGTAIVSSAGTIQSISIGNSGSGYRSGIQTSVSVGVVTSSLGAPQIHFIGTASVSNGHIVSVAITNPGFGYTSSNPPIVVFDDPLSYYNIPLVYSSGSSGIGTGARVNIVVSQASNVINFDIVNYGFGYEIGDVLTVQVGGLTGIQTNSSGSFKEFQLTVDQIYQDSFSGWTLGDLQLLDSVNDLIDGKRTVFPIKINGQQTSLRARKGSNIDIQANLLVFVNDVLQVPGEGYIFDGGSTIEFTEAPQLRDNSGESDEIKMLFYRGTGDIDTKNVDILEPVEVGDSVTVNSKDKILSENERIVENIISADAITTNPYFGVGISSSNLNRSITLCKQTEDRFVNGTFVAKNRREYEPLIFPVTNIIQNVGTSSTQFFVENIKTFFDNGREYASNETEYKSIRLLSQNTIVAAAATAIVSSSGTISSLVISSGGVGYTTSPTVIIQNPVGSGLTVGIGTTAAVIATISVGGTVSSLSITNSGFGYTTSSPPIVIIEPPKPVYEDITNVSYKGDFGIIVGIATTSVAGIAQTGIIFDLFVPPSSYLNDNSINVGFGTTSVSGIQTGYLFVVSNSNVGNGVTSINSTNSVVGVGSTFLDNIYSAVVVSTAQTSVPGIGLTYVSRVTVSVKNYNGLTGLGYSEFFGNYSWGLITNLTRKNPQSFTAYNAGYSGISSSPIVIRNKPLKFVGYSTT